MWGCIIIDCIIALMVQVTSSWTLKQAFVDRSDAVLLMWTCTKNLLEQSTTDYWTVVTKFNLLCTCAKYKKLWVIPLCKLRVCCIVPIHSVCIGRDWIMLLHVAIVVIHCCKLQCMNNVMHSVQCALAETALCWCRLQVATHHKDKYHNSRLNRRRIVRRSAL